MKIIETIILLFSIMAVVARKSVVCRASDCGKNIEFEELKHLLETENVTFIDVRTPKELSVDGRLPYPSVINIPVAELREALEMEQDAFQTKYGANKPKIEDTIVFSCRSGKRATNAQQTAIQLGYISTRLYAGSFNDWSAHDGPILKG